MNFTTNNNGRAFTSPEGYVIRRDTAESTAYWKCFAPNGKEIAGGAGDQGWLKCVHYAERLHELNQHCAQAQAGLTAESPAHAKQPAAPAEGCTTRGKSRDETSALAAGTDSNNDGSPQQSSLL